MTFKLRYFPGDNCDIQALCQELVTTGIVKLYGNGLAFIPQFGKHQHVNPRESASILPEPPTSTRHDASARVKSKIDPQVGREGKGREGNDAGASFAIFYEAYPKKEAKKDAEAAFAKLNPDAELLAKMLAAIEAKRKSPDWQKEKGKFVPLPATWIRAERWNDEIGYDNRTADIWAGAVN